MLAKEFRKKLFGNRSGFGIVEVLISAAVTALSKWRRTSSIPSRPSGSHPSRLSPKTTSSSLGTVEREAPPP